MATERGTAAAPTAFDPDFTTSELEGWLTTHKFFGAAQATRINQLTGEDVDGCNANDLTDELGVDQEEAERLAVSCPCFQCVE